MRSSEVVSVEAELDTTHARRNLQIGTGNSSFGTGNSSFGTAKSPFVSSPFLLHFDIIFQCRGCSPDTTLLTNDASRCSSSSFCNQTARRVDVFVLWGQWIFAHFQRRIRRRLERNSDHSHCAQQGEVRFVILAVGETAEVAEISCPAQVDVCACPVGTAFSSYGLRML